MSPALDTHRDVVAETCARFERTTGCPLVLVRCRAEEVVAVEERLRREAPGRWTTRLAGDDGPTGVLYCDPPTDGSGNGPSVTDLASLVADLLAECTTTAAQLESRVREVSTLVEIGRTLPSAGDPAEAIRRLLRGVLDLTRFRATEFLLLEPETHTLHPRATDGLDPITFDTGSRPLADGPPDLEALVRGDVSLRRGHDAWADRWLPEGIASGSCVAIPTEDGRIGTLWGYDRRNLAPADRDLDVLRSIAAQFGGLLERTALREESADQRRRRDELAVISAGWTFDVVRGLPRHADYDVAAACTSRHEVGGDLCEFVPVDEHRSVIVVGDACGDSVPGALVVSAVRGMLHGLLDDPEGTVDHLCPPLVVGRLNRVLCRVTAESQFASLVYGVLDTKQMTFTYTNAGHPCPLHVSSRGIATLQSHGLLLGVLPDSAYGHQTVKLAPGDLLVGFTDGITEARLDHGMFRSEGVVEALTRLRDRPVLEIVESIWSEVDAGNDPEVDDRTLIAVRVRPGKA